ncbi:MAG: Mrp/NBP35 family ATP-binding protein [Candidatus Nanopelagicaceae bacterium]
MNLQEDSIRSALAKVNDPELRKPITELGMVDAISINGAAVSVRILLTISGCPMRDRLQHDVTAAILEVTGIDRVDVEFGVMTEEQRNEVKRIVRGGRDKEIPFARPDSLTRVIGIASGKGGVGKSSVTANLAIALSQSGFSVGILDADVYGHSIPRLMGVAGIRPTVIDQLFIPVEGYGVKVVSMEMFKPDRADPIAYRGPLLHRVLEQLLTDAYWGDLDFLLLDLPPGTGDIAISLAQLIPNSELLVVTTPQVAASEVAERAGRIAHQLKQRILGVIENMSAAPCPHCGGAIDLFGNGGGEESAKRLGNLVGAEVPLLSKIPFDIALRSGGDEGHPIVIAHPESAPAKAFSTLASHLSQRSDSLVGKRLGILR